MGLVTRRQAVLAALGSGICGSMSISPVLGRAIAAQTPEATEITGRQISEACWIADVRWTDEQCEEVAKSLNRKLAGWKAYRQRLPSENVPMPLAYRPSFFLPADEKGNLFPFQQDRGLDASVLPVVPKSTGLVWDNRIEDVLEWSIKHLAYGLRQKWFTSEDLTEFYFQRLKDANEKLLCVVRMNEAAIETAKERDKELASGTDRGLLHGIPWGAKDIIAVRGLPCSWGVGRYEDREWQETATVARRLQEAGAVLLAKLSVGTLAWGDVWHGGQTKNPWNPEQGSSGSSAGSASAVAARLCPFAIGTETLGSIVSPTRVCGTSGLRPTFGRVSRAGCMTLSWTMDKVGPIANRVEDCEAIFAAILGPDGLDPTVVELPWTGRSELTLQGLRVGVTSRMNASERESRSWFEGQGAEIVELQFPDAPIRIMSDALGTEAASVHEMLFRDAKEDSELGKWGPSFREAQWVRAVDYLHGMRWRVAMIRETESELRKVDLLIGDGDLSRMNLTGHPTLVVSFGEEESERKPRTVALTGRMFSEGVLLSAGAAIQEAKPFVVFGK
ncbi:Glutamyl-tRNA(Gln) amidotransferase subunit A [Pirellula sp. SH-Sr6A]|uniref:amidase n=1 Tax=Pirellula sp. SH-Sr6A TaxID=1632865 RepID=UPI00078CD179|nr:amidase [Pirellula sp. SH-Sr6A]AMV32738.1 Glutamyl-tRNA(Gln) amidotransferase subunit A [Pirellula sp. SH-Sr6A]